MKWRKSRISRTGFGYGGVRKRSREVSSTVKLGISDGKYHIPDDINQYDEQIEKLFGI